MEEENTYSSVIAHKGFLNLWINQILVQLSYNSLNFALIIWVFHLTNSNTAVSALLLSVYLPAAIFGLFSGILIDLTDRRKIIIIIDLFLALLFFTLTQFKTSYPIIIVITFLVNTLAQFYIPAESSAIPLIVPRKQLLIANSLFSTTLYMSFLIGFGLAGPLINHLGIDFIFIMGGILLTGAFVIALRFLPSIVDKTDIQSRRLLQAVKIWNFSVIRKAGINEINETVHLIKAKLPVLFSIFILAGVQVVIGTLAVLVPSFLEQVVQINATDASYVLVIPLGFGMVTGGFIINKISQLFPRRRIVGTAILSGALLFLTVGMAPLVSPVIKYFPKPHPLPFFYQPPISAVLAVGSFFLGIALVSIIVPSQTVLQENTHEGERGKVFAVLGVIMAVLSIIPVLLTGILADIFGTMPIFIAMGGSIAIIGFFALKPDFFFAEKHLPPRIREFLGHGHWKTEKIK